MVSPLFVLATLIVAVWILAHPIIGFCRKHGPRGTSEVLHGLRALLTSLWRSSRRLTESTYREQGSL